MENKKGFTLVEIIIYLALFALIFIMIIEFAIFIRQANSSASNATKLDNSSIFASQSISSYLNNISTIDLLNSSLEDDNGVLSFLTNTGQNLIIEINNARLRINNNGFVNFITPEGVQITRLRFTPIYTSDIQSNKIIGINVSLKLIIDKEPEPLKEREINTNYFLINP